MYVEKLLREYGYVCTLSKMKQNYSMMLLTQFKIVRFFICVIYEYLFPLF